MSDFAEKAGIISHATDFGKWYQTVAEVTIIINLEPGTRGKEVQVTILPKKLKCIVKGQIILEVSLQSLYSDTYPVFFTDNDVFLG